MKPSITFTAKAQDDVGRATKWYREQGPGLEHRFLDELAAYLGVVGLFPNGSVRISPSLRMLPMRRFPFAMTYRSNKCGIFIARIVHNKRHPKHRLR